MSKKIINIINFIRGVEPRHPTRDLVEPVVNQIRLSRQYNLKTTFLFQYDALIDKRFTDLFIDNNDDNFEIGAWLEMAQPLIEKAGMPWRGREGFPWDWHANVGFSIGYTPEEREIIIDTYMNEFKHRFGKYPNSLGSWFMDAHVLSYLEKNYPISSVCICRDQWGTDGYNLWGGYYNQAFYPCRKNMLCPAQNKENQINIPVFRIYGSDPIYQYDSGLGDDFNPSNWQSVITLEPVYPHCGGNMDWVKWFFRECFDNPALSFSYAITGQENSFGWSKMKEGLENQYKLIAEKVSKGELEALTLKESGEWFKSRYPETPASSFIARKDWKNHGRRSAWFYNSYYRVNMFFDNEVMWIRDLHKFDEKYQERYVDKVCESKSAIFDNLPMVDGYRWSGSNIRSGLYFVEINQENGVKLLKGKEPVLEMGDRTLSIKWELENQSKIHIDIMEKYIKISCNGEIKTNWALHLLWNPDADVPVEKVCSNRIEYSYNSYLYNLNTEKGICEKSNTNCILIRPVENMVILRIHD